MSEHEARKEQEEEYRKEERIRKKLETMRYPGAYQPAGRRYRLTQNNLILDQEQQK